MEESQLRRIRDLAAAGEEARLSLEAGGRTFVRRFQPKPRLILLGGGHVALALCGFGARLGFSVAVCDDRPAFANEARFPEADRVICDSFEAAVRQLELRDSDYVCVMTRGHRWDRACLDAIFAGLQPAYLGMLGSHRRSAGMRRALLEAGAPAERVEALRAPIGLAIGAVTPEEIAVSVCAQLIQCRRAAEPPAADCLEETAADPAVLDFLAEADRPRALLMVVSVQDSTPAKPGAMMAVDRLGTALGTVGGGCAEAAAMARARRLIGSGEQVLFSVDLSDEEAAREGMVCGGSMEVLIADVTAPAG